MYYSLVFGSEILSEGKNTCGLTFSGDCGWGLESEFCTVGLLGSSSESDKVLPELPLWPPDWWSETEKKLR